MDVDEKVNQAPWYARPAYEDPQNSMDVFARGLVNAFGQPYCVHVALAIDEAMEMVQKHNDGLKARKA